MSPALVGFDDRSGVVSISSTKIESDMTIYFLFLTLYFRNKQNSFCSFQNCYGPKATHLRVGVQRSHIVSVSNYRLGLIVNKTFIL